MMLGASINEEREKLMDTMKNLSTSAYAAIGMMLFALFFGAGNLIFPASLGQQAGDNVGWAILGFILTGVGLPLLGVIAMGYSGCKNAEELAGRVSPLYGRLYTVLLYLSIGPFFAIPRTGTVSYEIAVKPFFKNAGSVEETVFLVAFFAISLWLSINPHKLVNRIGKVLTPALLTVIVLLIIKSFITPIGGYSVAQGNYVTTGSAVLQGFLDGYNTMDALASICFAVLVIDFVKLAGAHTNEQITSSTAGWVFDFENSKTQNHKINCAIVQFGTFSRNKIYTSIKLFPSNQKAKVLKAQEITEEITEETFRAVFKNSAVKRAKYDGLKRNIDFLK